MAVADRRDLRHAVAQVSAKAEGGAAGGDRASTARKDASRLPHRGRFRRMRPQASQARPVPC
jgi:hypothetical protein